MDAFVVVHENLIKKAIIGQPGNPDWNGILNLINVMESQPSSIPIFTELFVRHLKKDPNGLKLNTLMVIDALFKNGKKSTLKQLQTKYLTQGLNQPEITEDPTLHNFIYQNAGQWIASCRDHDCLNDDFGKWQAKFCSSYFIPELTEELAAKFNNELDSAAELLTVFSQCLITTFAEEGSSDNPILNEILGNVRELERRTDKLLPTLNDPDIRNYCALVFELSKVCIRCFNDFAKNNSFDTDVLMNILTKVQKEKQRRDAKHEPVPVIKRKPLRTAGDDITDEEFWSELHKLKEKEIAPEPLINLGTPQPAQPTDIIDSLLDF
jgi:hypothetical protein